MHSLSPAIAANTSGFVSHAVSAGSILRRKARLLELGIHRAEQRGDRRSHRLIGDINDDRDRCQDQCILSHRLAAYKSIGFHKILSDQVHFVVPTKTNCSSIRLPAWSLDRRGGAAPAGVEIRPMLELELGVHRGEQRGDGRAHLLVGNEHDNCDGSHDQRVLSHRLTLLALGQLYKQFRQLIHFPCPSVRLSLSTNYARASYTPEPIRDLTNCRKIFSLCSETLLLDNNLVSACS